MHVKDEDVAVVKLGPGDLGQLADDRLALALHDVQLGRRVLGDVAQAGRHSALQDPSEEVLFKIFQS